MSYYVWTVANEYGLPVYSGPGIQYSKVDFLEPGTEIIERARSTSSNPLFIRFGVPGPVEYWIMAKNGSLESMTSVFVDTGEPVEINTQEVTEIEENAEDGTGVNFVLDDLGIFGVYDDGEDASTYDAIHFDTKNTIGILGMPYQFLPHADPRISSNTSFEPNYALGHSTNVSDSYGEEFAERIYSKIPILFITPGKASFMTKFNQAQKESILETLFLGKQVGNELDDLLQQDGRYYTFEYSKGEFYKYVNPMCRIAARFLNLQDFVLDGEPLDRVNWEKHTSLGFQMFSSLKNFSKNNANVGAIPIYLNSDTSISENISSSTTESSLSSGINGLSDKARELQFILGYSTAATSITNTTMFGGEADMMDTYSNIQNLTDSIAAMLGKGAFITSLASHLTAVASGGRLIFPEIWSDSSFGRSYSVEVKLVSPDNSKLGLFLNIVVPLMHLIALATPRAFDNNPNGYGAPFLVRAIYKGLFAIDTGIITGMSITKGSEGIWSPEGIPSVVNVSFEIKDLYDTLSITKSDAENFKFSAVNNTALMDYIATTCGINIFEPEIGRMVDMWWINNVENRVDDFLRTNIFTGLETWVQNKIMRMYR